MTPERWTLPLITRTPAFVGGADPNDSAEIRVSSIRGVLRFWYRLIVGPAVAAGLSPEHAAFAEARLFGGTGRGEGQGAVLLSVADAPTGTMHWSNRDLRRDRPGLAYLGFSLDMPPNNRKAVPPGVGFQLQLVLPRGLDEPQRDLLAATLWAWVTLGGLGSRSRRGFGSLDFEGPVEVSAVRGDKLPVPSALNAQAPPGSFPDLAARLDAGAQTIAQARRQAGIEDQHLLLRRAPPGRDVVHADPSYVLLSTDSPWPKSRLLLWAGGDRRGFASAGEALNTFGQRFAELRRTKGIDALPAGALGMLQRGERLPLAPRRTAFGLPLALRPVGKGGGAGFELLPYTVVEAGDNVGRVDPRAERIAGGRAPSPLLVSVTSLGARYAVLLTLLSGPWPGRDLPLRERKQTRGFIPTDPKNDLPAELFRRLERAMEVPL